MKKMWFVFGFVGLTGCSSRSQPPVVASIPTPESSQVVQPTAPTPVDVPPLAPTSTPSPPTGQELTIQQEIAKLKTADPTADFETAWQQGDHRFAALDVGVGYRVPGVRKEIETTVIMKYGMKIICSPGDVGSEGMEELRKLGDGYGAQYNHLLLKKLRID